MDMASRQKKIGFIIFFLLIAWWAVAICFYASPDKPRELWSDAYGIMALYGSVIGLINAHAWGGWKTRIGRALFFFSAGLICQIFGQTAYGVLYYVEHVAIAYPSIGDFGYFGSVVCYLIGAVYLVKSLKALEFFRVLSFKIIFAFFTLLLAVLSYPVFYRTFSEKIFATSELLLGVGYILADSFLIIILLVVYLYALGKMRGLLDSVARFLLVSAVVLYMADFWFFYELSVSNWQNSGASDFLYFVSYFCFTMTIIKFRSIYDNTQVVDGVGCPPRRYFPANFFKAPV